MHISIRKCGLLDGCWLAGPDGSLQAKLFGASFMVATQEMEDTSVPSEM